VTRSELHYESLVGMGERIGRREISPVAVTQAMLDRIAALDGRFHSYATVLSERALARAAAAEKEIGNGIRRGPLHGVPIAIKDLCYTTYAPTAGGMTIHRSFTPDHNATVVDRLEQAGAVILGKL
jgi:amidase